MGQKQLLSLTRALLCNNKFLILDEATSNLDAETDAFIQGVIREKFRQTTVLTVANRLNTIADYNRIIVIEKGEIVEDGEPYDLMQKKGTFHDLVKHSGKNDWDLIA